MQSFVRTATLGPPASSKGEKQVFWRLRRLFLLAAAAVAAVAIAVGVLHELRRSAEQWTLHGREVARIARETKAMMAERETGIREFLLSGDSSSIEPARRARPILSAAFDSLVDMTADNPAQQARARAMRAAADIDGFRRANDDFLRAEELLYEERVKRDGRLEALSLLVMFIALSALGGVLRWMYRRTGRQATELFEQQALLEEQAAELEMSAAELEATNEELQEAATEMEMANDDMRESAGVAAVARDALESMVDRMSDSFIELDAEWRITYMNTAASVSSLQNLDDVRGRTLWDVYPASVGSELERQYRKAMTEQVPVSFTHHYNDLGRLNIWVEINAYPSASALTLLYRDVTKQKMAEEIVERRDFQFSEAQHLARMGSWEYDVASRQSTWSEEMGRVLGQPPQAVASLDAMIEHVIDDDRARVRAAVDRAVSHSDPFSIECRLRCPDGTMRSVHARGSATCDSSGRTTRIVGTVQDVTERRQLQEQLQQAQKMEAVGQLAGGVAHDFNNVLTAIKSFSELIALELPTDSPLRGDVGEITAAADRAAALTRHLLAFSRRQMLQPVVLNPNTVVEGVTRLLARLLGVDVRCETLLAPDLGSVLADPGQLEQVLINLAVNARDAMPNGGTLTLGTANFSLDDAHATLLSGVEVVEPGEYVALTVTDTGEGMDAATKARIFEPFFTTKEVGKGTGLGLSTVYGIVRQSGGYVSVYSEIGCGTTFRVYLPLVVGDVPVQLPKAAPLPSPNGKETILLVDDDDAVRAVAARILARSGYEVLTAASPREAETIWTDYEGPIHLLITDLMMPEMHGGELANRLLESRKGSRVLYTSGYTNESVIRRGLIISDMPFLAKPFTIDSVTRKVREVLGN